MRLFELTTQSSVLLLCVGFLLVDASPLVDQASLSTLLTPENFMPTIQGAIHGGRTIFVRWESSLGCECCEKDSPAWHQVLRDFASNDAVQFAEVSMSPEPSHQEHQLNFNGWPTIMYFNNNTGSRGGNHPNHGHNMNMCDELGHVSSLIDYVEEFGRTSKCNVTTKAVCSEREVAYIEKMVTKSPIEIQSQFDRLSGMEGSSMKPELNTWIVQRKKILRQLDRSSTCNENETHVS